MALPLCEEIKEVPPHSEPKDLGSGCVLQEVSAGHTGEFVGQIL
jgi:hypothetical protein